MSAFCLYGSANNATFFTTVCSQDINLPISRGADFFFDVRSSRPFQKLAASSSVIFAAGFIISAALGATGREYRVCGALVCMFLLSATVHFLAGVGLLLVESDEYATIWFLTPQV